MLQRVFSIIVAATKGLGRLIWVGPELLWRRRRALGTFQEQLFLQGLDQKTIKKLTENYKQMGNIQSWMSERDK